MRKTAEELREFWLIKANKNPKATGPACDRVVIAGNFLTYVARMNPDKVGDYLKGFDFSKDVKLIKRLPSKTYVQYVNKYTGHWFTDTGLTPDAVGIVEGCRKRHLFEPYGTVVALQGTAAGIRDVSSLPAVVDMEEMKAHWEKLKKLAATLDQPIELKDKTFEKWKSRVGSMTSGGGVQYFVAEPSKMSLIK